jgi:signal transduction histidine kinase/CheY-like chemotaxis protein
MAIEDDRRAVEVPQGRAGLARVPWGSESPGRAGSTQANAASPLSGWFVVTGAVLILSLLAAFFVQARQYALLNQAVQGQDDYLVLNLFQLETEYLRLRERWRQASGDPASARDQLQLRYDIFVSRIGLLQTDRAQRVLAESPEYGAALRALRDFVDRCDLYLGQAAPPAPFSNASMQALLGDLDALDSAIHQMLLAGAHRVAQQVTLRNDAIAQHNRVGLALTAFLSAMVGAFGFLALRRMRQLDDSRRAMEAMANRLHDAREQALRASQAKSEFLTSMSHAIRTPFHGMLGMLSLLRESKLDPRQQDLLRTAVDSADHLLSLLNDIVDLSKLEAGNLALDVHEVDLAALVREVERLMRARAIAKGLQLSAAIDATVPARLQLDGTRVRQILYNLVANAIRFTDSGSVSVRCTRLAARASQERPQADDIRRPPPVGIESSGKATLTQEAMLEIEVADTGVGMDADTVQRLFERSRLQERGAGRADTVRRSTGLGLEIAHRLARLMGGDIAVESTPGIGSVLRVRLPLRMADAIDAVPQAPASSAAAAQHARHVLVAEDNAVNRLYLAALLDRMGHSAHFVENGLEALQAVQEHRFDIVLMDVHMPVMDGIAATQAIRALDAQGAELPIVALTADAYADTRTRCLAAGMNDVLVKPLGLPELEALFQRRFGAGAVRAPDATARSGQSVGASMALLDTEVLARLVELMPRADAAQLYAALLTQAGDATARMRRALREADTDELRRVSHGLKGAALNLGLRALAEAADRLSGSAASTNASQLALNLQRFDETLAATRALCANEPALSP